MQYSTLLLAALATLISAQNPFTLTTLTTLVAGQPFTITWAPSTGSTDTISLLLRQGNSASLNTVATIASKIPNSGTYVWTPSTSLPQGTDYALEIVDDGNINIVNYSNQFTITSTNTNTISPSVTSAISQVSSAAASSFAGTSAPAASLSLLSQSPTFSSLTGTASSSGTGTLSPTGSYQTVSSSQPSGTKSLSSANTSSANSGNSNNGGGGNGGGGNGGGGNGGGSSNSGSSATSAPNSNMGSISVAQVRSWWLTALAVAMAAF